MLKLKDVSRKLAIKYAISPTMPSAQGPDLSATHIPKAPKVPQIQEYIPNLQTDTIPPDSDFEVKTNRFNTNSPTQVIPMDSEMQDAPNTMSPEQLSGMSDYRTNLINAVDSMYYNNAITHIHRHKLTQQIQRASDDAHLYELHKELKNTVAEAESNAINYAKKMKAILSTLD